MGDRVDDADDISTGTLRAGSNTFRAVPGGEHQPLHIVLVHICVGLYICVSAAAPLLYGPELLGGTAVATLIAFVYRTKLPRAAFYWTLGLGVLGLVGTLIGLLHGNPGAMATISIYIVEPVLIGLALSIYCSTARGVTVLLRSLDMALVAVAVGGVLVYLTVPIAAITGSTYNVFDLTGGTLRTNYQGYNSLVFLAPYGLVRGLSSHIYPELRTVRRAALTFAALSGIVLSGRHILYVEVPVAIVCCVLVRRSRRRSRQGGPSRLRPLIAGIGGLAVVGMSLNVIGITVADAMSRTLSQITIDDTSGTRPIEADLLLQRWADSPIIGQGTGAVIPGYARSERPWEFELTYHSALMQFGLAGGSVLIAFGLWIVCALWRLSRASLYSALAVECGFVGSLLACIVDPYFLASDGLWMVFVPFAFAVWHRHMLKDAVGTHEVVSAERAGYLAATRVRDIVA